MGKDCVITHTYTEKGKRNQDDLKKNDQTFRKHFLLAPQQVKCDSSSMGEKAEHINRICQVQRRKNFHCPVKLWKPVWNPHHFLDYWSILISFTCWFKFRSRTVCALSFFSRPFRARPLRPMPSAGQQCRPSMVVPCSDARVSLSRRSIHRSQVSRHRNRDSVENFSFVPNFKQFFVRLLLLYANLCTQQV